MVKSRQNKKSTNISKIKSNYILKQIFAHLNEKYLLEFIKYNKSTQKRIDIDINNYIEFSKLYSSIEIELKVVEGKSGKYINMHQEDKEYFHIYFNNSKKEMKKVKNYKDVISKIKIIIAHQVTSFEELFKDCEYIESINFKKFNRNNITNMNDMFCNCSSLKKINLEKFNTENVIEMRFMFHGCKSLEKLDLSNFNTKNLTDTCYMFSKCYSLKEVDLSKFNTEKVIV